MRTVRPAETVIGTSGCQDPFTLCSNDTIALSEPGLVIKNEVRASASLATLLGSTV